MGMYSTLQISKATASAFPWRDQRKQRKPLSEHYHKQIKIKL